MSADVTEATRYQAYCRDCRWWSDEFEWQDSADDAADEHDAENHAP
jgi:hypothetical protein